MAKDYTQNIADLRSFVLEEQAVADQKLQDIWIRPLAEKLETGWTQAFTHLELASESDKLWAYLDEGESRFREGDLLYLHGGSPADTPFGRRLSFEREEDGRWLLAGKDATRVFVAIEGRACFADPDAIDLTDHYRQTLDDIASQSIGIDIILPLINGDLEILFDERDAQLAEQVAITEGLNAKQAKAVGAALGAEHVACIQGPPGTGKTQVLSLIARLMVQRGDRVMITSHTHMGINNALNKVHAQGVPTVKIGPAIQRKGLNSVIECHPGFSAWEDRPKDGGYVIGATPFATCSKALMHCEFDVIIFDEASQVTIPLALMAMRRGKKYIFIGDHKQLPPVLQSQSILSKTTRSIFSTLTSEDQGVMLTETYRMNRWLTEWPSQQYYGGKLTAAGTNKDQQLLLTAVPDQWRHVFEPSACSIFIPTLDRTARTRNMRDAQLVSELCGVAVSGGLSLQKIGIVTPFRAQGRAIKNLLINRFGRSEASLVVSDTVERMQGQERDLIILSLATGDEVFLGAIASFFLQPERLNVSITRPRFKLIVIGPELHKVPNLEDELIKPWVNQYIDLIKHMKRVEV